MTYFYQKGVNLSWKNDKVQLNTANRQYNPSSVFKISEVGQWLKEILRHAKFEVICLLFHNDHTFIRNYKLMLYYKLMFFLVTILFAWVEQTFYCCGEL